MKGKHLTQSERFYIEKQRSEGVNPSAIARVLGVSRSTLSRELRRNIDPDFNGLYSSRRAQTLAMARRQSPASRNAFNRLSPETQDFIHRELALHTSPEVISGRLRLKSGVAVSKNTLYRHIHRDRLSGGELYLQLPHRGKRYRYDTGEPGRTPIPDRMGIEFRATRTF